MGMRRVTWLAAVCFACALPLSAQVEQLPESQQGPGQTQAPPRSDSRSHKSREGEESSSRDTRIDIAPPGNDAKEHPFSSSTVQDAEDDSSGGVQEFHAWDPHKAAKDIEVGDFYFKRKNYRAALDRYKEALQWKNNDAMANLRLAQCYEKVNDPEQAAAHYQAYLKILPHGEFAADAQKALDKLKSPSEDKQAKQ